MSELNVNVEGFIATEPSQGTTQAGKAYLSVSVAHNERRKNQQSGQWENAKDKDGNDIVSWIRATFWEEEAISLSNQLAKGTLITLRGNGRVTAYTDQSGVARGQLEVLWPKIAIVPRKQSQQAQQGGFGGGSGQGQDSWAKPPANGPQNGGQGFGGGADFGQPF